jgi:hypothetical protein
MDLTGELPETYDGNRFIMVVKCRLTKAIELIPLKNKTELAVAQALTSRIYYRHGSPRVIHSDRGSEFVNRVMEHVNALFMVKHVVTTPYNPRANGLVEEHNAVLKDQLKAFADAQQRNWDQHLDTIQFAYQTTVHSQTGFTPFFLLYDFATVPLPEAEGPSIAIIGICDVI